VSTIEELRERKSGGSGLKSREYGCRDLLRCPRGTIYPQKLSLTALTSGCRSVAVVRSRTKGTEFTLDEGVWEIGGMAPLMLTSIHD
jgi:hypothetical protein